MKKKSQAILLIGSGIAVFLIFMVLPIAGIDDPFRYHANAVINIRSTCQAIVICGFDEQSTDIEFKEWKMFSSSFGQASAQPLVWFQACDPMGLTGGRRISMELEIPGADYYETSPEVRVCQPELHYTFKNIYVNPGECYDYTLKVYDEETGLLSYTKEGERCFQ